ncbi:hypothetical protein K5L04_06835 [Flavobacterium psychrophilum]|uniref:hypothetical protein n=1 Tax=Flavobacterium psychrophilum TaxID=96345 RepID=UPI000B7C54D4|nr:hypothetical protein [Flavobacterium psychrophilum]EKT3967297.1 hypothetical protein [Flavobacterium psychrophilum]EKT4499454.1 hypothetical protein [Flavobacterium psychrophilum]ELM3649757.1 hypothetical protein [Flavobacterium psychrophilum]ELM3671073.1 hypothetical protein [Flavobacterium psychrophilum]ELM3725587.1 hypothetical protein [Flavobacterium psychrophilum]
MYKQYFGRRRRMRFDSPEEYYETLGFIANANGSFDLYREDNQNQGAWNYEVRMNCYSDLHRFTPPLKRKFTKGRAKKVLHRINCNEFFEDLVNTHHFAFLPTQNATLIRTSIPQQYLVDFDRGFAI